MTEYCAKCHTAFGTAERRQKIDVMRSMHQHCYEEHLKALSARAEARQPYVNTPRPRWLPKFG